MRAVLAEQLRQARVRQGLAGELAAHKAVHVALLQRNDTVLTALAAEQRQRRAAEERAGADDRAQRDAQRLLATQYETALKVVAAQQHEAAQTKQEAARIAQALAAQQATQAQEAARYAQALADAQAQREKQEKQAQALRQRLQAALSLRQAEVAAAAASAKPKAAAETQTATVASPSKSLKRRSAPGAAKLAPAAVKPREVPSVATIQAMLMNASKSSPGGPAAGMAAVAKQLSAQTAKPSTAEQAYVPLQPLYAVVGDERGAKRRKRAARRASDSSAAAAHKGSAPLAPSPHTLLLQTAPEAGAASAHAASAHGASPSRDARRKRDLAVPVHIPTAPSTADSSSMDAVVAAADAAVAAVASAIQSISAVGKEHHSAHPEAHVHWELPDAGQPSPARPQSAAVAAFVERSAASAEVDLAHLCLLHWRLQVAAAVRARVLKPLPLAQQAPAESLPGASADALAALREEMEARSAAAKIMLKRQAAQVQELQAALLAKVSHGIRIRRTCVLYYCCIVLYCIVYIHCSLMS